MTGTLEGPPPRHPPKKNWFRIWTGQFTTGRDNSQRDGQINNQGLEALGSSRQALCLGGLWPQRQASGLESLRSSRQASALKSIWPCRHASKTSHLGSSSYNIWNMMSVHNIPAVHTVHTIHKLHTVHIIHTIHILHIVHSVHTARIARIFANLLSHVILHIL